MIYPRYNPLTLPYMNWVTTNGCFDLFHLGHVRSLRFCRKYAEEHDCGLIVLVNTDESIARIKPGRPIVPYSERVQMVEAIVPTALIFPLWGDDPAGMLDTIKPKYHIKGSEYEHLPMPEREVVEHNGGKVVFCIREEGILSTSDRIRRCVELWWTEKG